MAQIGVHKEKRDVKTRKARPRGIICTCSQGQRGPTTSCRDGPNSCTWNPKMASRASETASHAWKGSLHSKNTAGAANNHNRNQTVRSNTHPSAVTQPSTHHTPQREKTCWLTTCCEIVMTPGHFDQFVSEWEPAANHALAYQMTEIKRTYRTNLGSFSEGPKICTIL